MAAIYSDQDQYDAMAAATTAVDGTKRAAFLGVWQTRLGTNPLVKLYRDSVQVWSGSITGLLPIVGATFVVPQSIGNQVVAAADIDTGTWQFRIENAGNPAIYYGAGVTKLGATNVLALADDLVADGGVAMGSVVFTSPALDTEAAAFSSADARRFMWVDPNFAFAAQPTNAGLQIRDATDGQNIRGIAEPGVIGASGDYTFSRGVDPTDAGKMTFRHKISPTFPLWQGTQRSQYTHGDMTLNEVYWWAYQFLIDSSWAAAGSFNPGDIHHNSWTAGPEYLPSNERVVPGPLAPIETICSGAASPTYVIRVNGNYTLGQTNSITTNVHSSGAQTVGTWHRFVFRFRVTRSAADSPFVQVWRQIDAGAETQIVDRSDVAIGYANMLSTPFYCKPGLYQWSASASTRTMHTKGSVIMREASGSPDLTAANLFALLRSL